MANPFIIKPLSPVFVEENSTEKFLWEIESCGWEVRIVTEEYTLHPNIFPTRVPIKMHTDYNVSITPKKEDCKESIMNTSVTLSITFRENVLEHVEYIICKFFRHSNDKITHESRVDINITVLPPAETTVTLMSTTIMSTAVMPTGSVSTVETTTNSGWK